MLYKYTAKNMDKSSCQYRKVVKGVIKASSENDAIKKLDKLSISVDSLEEVYSENCISYRFNTISLDDKILFSRQMTIMLKSGVDILDALSTVSKISKSKTLRNELRKVHHKIKEGYPISTSLSDKFDDVIKQYVRVGEETGNLSYGFELLSKHFIFLQDTNRKFKQALNQPKQLIIMIFMVITLMLIFVFPVLLEGFRGELPLPTRIVLYASDAVIYSPHIILFVIFSCYFCYKSMLSRGLDIWVDEYKHKIPVVGRLIQKYELVCFSMTFSSLFKAHINITDALCISANTTGNKWFIKRIEVMNKSIISGGSIYNSALEAACFDLTTEVMIRVADKTGQIENVFDDLSDYYLREINFELNMFNERIKPFVLYFCGGMTLLVVLAIWMPMLENLAQLL